MLQRIIDVFWPPKWKAALAAVFCLGLAVLLYSGPLAMLGAAALTYGLWYAGVWLFKFSRDKRLAAPARVIQPPQQVMPSRTTPESSQLFVPPQHPGER